MKRTLKLLGVVLVTLFVFISWTYKSIDKANTLIETGAFDQAIKILDNEIQDDPKNKEAYLAMANCLATKYADLVINEMTAEEALKRKTINYYKGAIQIDPNYTSAHYNLNSFIIFINALQKNPENDTQNIVEAFLKALKIDENSTYDGNVEIALSLFSDWPFFQQYLKLYLEKILNNDVIEIVPQQNKFNELDNDAAFANRMKIFSSLLVNEDQKIVFKSGKAYKGTPKGVIIFLYPSSFQLIKKRYIGNDCYEELKDKKTNKVLHFNNNLLEKVT